MPHGYTRYPCIGPAPMTWRCGKARGASGSHNALRVLLGDAEHSSGAVCGREVRRTFTRPGRSTSLSISALLEEAQWTAQIPGRTHLPDFIGSNGMMGGIACAELQFLFAGKLRLLKCVSIFHSRKGCGTNDCEGLTLPRHSGNTGPVLVRFACKNNLHF